MPLHAITTKEKEMDGVLNGGTYTCGTNGALPTGQSITYSFAGSK